jgi:hypothetical protein
MSKLNTLQETMDTSNILESIAKRFPKIYFKSREYSSGELELEFSADQAKEYLFYLWLWPQISLVIGARLVGKPDHYFWYDSTDRTTRDEIEWEKQVHEFIVDTIDKLVNYRTRIIQRDGVFSSSFTCEYFDGNWKVMSKNSALKFIGLNTPKIQGRNKVYT